jgi:hypothetical protein
MPDLQKILAFDVDPASLEGAPQVILRLELETEHVEWFPARLRQTPARGMGPPSWGFSRTPTAMITSPEADRPRRPTLISRERNSASPLSGLPVRTLPETFFT